MRLSVVGFCVVSPVVLLLALASFSKPNTPEATQSVAKKTSTADGAPVSPTAVAEAVAAELKRCCPASDPGDTTARDRCSEALRNSAVLRGCMNDTVLWGGRPDDGKTYRPEPYNLTQFGSYVYRALYLSLFTFSGRHTLSESDGYLILHAACDFRGRMDTGAYPYPFWQKPGKWVDYQVCKNIDFVFEKGRVVAAYRSIEKKAGVKLVPHEFDGNWTWTSPDGKPMPSVELYNYVLSPTNPHRDDLELAYRNFEVESRKHRCIECHSPSNPAMTTKLTLLNYPNQALSARHRILEEVENRTMPPKSPDHPSGIADVGERNRLLELARRFAAAGDKAMDFEEKRSAGPR